MEDDRTGHGEAETTGVGASGPSPEPQAPAVPDESEPGVDVLAELASRGHEAVNRVLDDLATDRRLIEAIDSLLAVRERLTEAARGARAQLDQGSGESVVELRARVDELERRLSDIEGAANASRGDPSAAELD